MTVHDPVASTLDREHKIATSEVNRWRGHCIDCFARIELAMVEAIDRMIASGRMPTLKRTALFGLRVEMLKKALADDTFGAKRGPPRKTLDALEPVLARRNALVHGAGRIWIHPDGGWVWHYRFLTNASAEPEASGVITSLVADQIERDLTSNSRRLGDTLRNLSASL